MKKTDKIFIEGEQDAIPVQLTEVAECGMEFHSHHAAEQFLGLPKSTLSAYVRKKTKIIKSKVDGKVYLIKRIAKSKVRP